jgi:Ser/Thr protein kinase RdoA (MazF antagonist)
MARYDEAAILERLEQSLNGFGIVGRLQLIRHGSTSVYRVAGASCIVRVTRSPLASGLEVEAKLRQIAQLAEAGAPLLSPAILRPVDLDEAWATVWPEGDTDAPDRFTTLGKVLRKLHSIDHPADLPQGVTRIDRVEWRIRRAEEIGVPAQYLSTIEARLGQVTPELHALNDLPTVLSHGDAYPGNLVRYHDADLFIDLADLCTAPKELDLAPSFVSARRFPNISDAYHQTLSGYGLSEATVNGHALEVFVALRELTMTSWLATLWGVEPKSHAELNRRIESWRDPSLQWAPL